VTSATTPGRYGAVFSLHLTSKRTLYVDQSAVLLPSRPSAAALGSALVQTYRRWQGTDPQLDQAIAAIGQKADALSDDPDLADILSAEMEAESDGQLARPKARAEAWWYQLRTSLGTETVYPIVTWYPPEYHNDPTRRYGAIIFLHGSGGNIPSDYGNMEARIRDAPAHDLLGWLKDHPQPFVVYEPLASHWWEAPAIADIVKRILRQDRIDPDQVILMGFSMGGISCWTCAVDYPSLWAAVVPIGGRGSQAAEMARVKDVPVWIFNGELDGITPLSEAQTAAAALTAAGGTVRLTVIHGCDHLGSQTAAISTPELWTWLIQQHRHQ
jgi:predicted esterase